MSSCTRARTPRAPPTCLSGRSSSSPSWALPPREAFAYPRPRCFRTTLASNRSASHRRPALHASLEREAQQADLDAPARLGARSAVAELGRTGSRAINLRPLLPPPQAVQLAGSTPDQPGSQRLWVLHLQLSCLRACWLVDRHSPHPGCADADPTRTDPRSRRATTQNATGDPRRRRHGGGVQTRTHSVPRRL
jgi:hypothetical protein